MGSDAYDASQDDVFAGGNLFVYYHEGDSKKCSSPDVMVASDGRRRPLEELRLERGTT